MLGYLKTSVLWGALISTMTTVASGGEPLRDLPYVLSSRKWAGDEARAFRGDGESPQYLSSDGARPRRVSLSPRRFSSTRSGI